MTMVGLESLVATTSQKASRIGWLFWYIISEGQTSTARTHEAFSRSGLPDKYRMPDIRPVDAYRRASKSIEGRITLQDDVKVELLVRDVWHDKNEVVRYLVVESRHTSGRRLDYDPDAAMLRFDHNYRTIDTDVRSSEPYVADAVNEFIKNYNLYLNTYDGPAKRRTVRAVLNDLAATSLKDSGGVYLVPRQNEELMFQLISFINDLPDCKAYKMPVEDTVEARDMVHDVVTNKAESILSEIRAALKADEVPEQIARQLLERARQVKREVVLYQEILKESIGTLETDVDLLEAQMMHLVERF
jgi:hypothetical protein